MQSVRITVISEACLRIEYSPSGRFCDWPSMFAANGPSGSPSLDGSVEEYRSVYTSPAAQGGREVIIETPRMRLIYKPDGRPPSPSNMRALITHPVPPPGAEVEHGAVVWTPGAPSRNNLGGTLETLDGVRGPVPLGDGLLSRDGFFLLDDSRSYLLVDAWPRSRESLGLGGNTDWYLFGYGDDYRAAFGALSVIGGGVPLPRRYALGSWYSRYWPYTSAEYRGIVAEYAVHGFPLDVIVLDMDWHKEGWTGWSWNREFLPDAEDLLAWIHDEQLAVTLNLHPADGVAPHEDRYPDFMRALGRSPDSNEHVPFDAGDQPFMSALFEKVLASLEHPPGRPRSGVDFWWVDWQQDRFVRSMPGLTNLAWLNTLFFGQSSRKPMGEARTDLDTTEVPSGRRSRGLGFSRWAGWGDHRHPIHFSGDAHTGWSVLAFQVPFTVSAGNAGCFYWSHDIGGHFGPRLEEATARWVQFGALSAALRLHSARSGSLDRRPWTYQQRFHESMRRAFELRATLMPAIYTAAWLSTRDTVPLLRPMYLDHPREDRAYECPQQYLFGPDFLVAPIVDPGVGERCVATQRVWFPPLKGQDGAWCDWTTGERHAAGDEAIVAADIDQVPLFVPAGAPIPTRPFTLRPATEPLKALVVRLFPGSPGGVHETGLYEDDGISDHYERGGHAFTPLRAEWSRGASDETGAVLVNLVIGPTVGSFDGQLDEREVIVEFAGVQGSLGATVGGLALTPEGMGDGRVRVSISAGSIRDALHITAELEPIDAMMIRERVRAARLEAAFGPLAAPTLRHGALAVYSAISDADPRGRARALEIGAGIGLVRCGIDENSLWRLVDSLGWIDNGAASLRVVDRLGPPGRPERPAAAIPLTLVRAPGRAACACSIALPVPPLDAPPPGLRASRFLRVEFTIDGMPITIEAEAIARLTPLPNWLVAGPFDWHWSWSIADRVHGPELQAFDPSQTFIRVGGEIAGWRPALIGDRLATDFDRSFNHRALAYARAAFSSPRAQRVFLVISAGSDKLQVFLNGAAVMTQDGFDSPAAAGGPIPIDLRAGENTLLVKAAESAAGWGFTLAIDGESALTPLVPAEPARRDGRTSSPAPHAG